jgi:membrane associated rhomboid family serine protease
MEGRPALSMALPKPRRALTVLLIAIAALGIAGTIVTSWVPGGAILFTTLACEPDRAFSQPWRLFTSGLLTSPGHWDHLLFSLVGLYFLGAPLERRWGSWRFARFFALAVLLGNLATIVVGAAVGAGAQARFHPELVFGPAAAIAAIAVAWSREYPDSIVNLFFVFPVKASAFLWITLGFCALDLIYPAALPEGVVAPLGGVVAALLLAGSPSPTRLFWLKMRLASLRRRNRRLGAKDLMPPHSPSPTRRSGSSPLRIVSGGLDDVLKKRPPPPKDKRYLN